jgi:hypothetical protein
MEFNRKERKEHKELSPLSGPSMRSLRSLWFIPLPGRPEAIVMGEQYYSAILDFARSDLETIVVGVRFCFPDSFITCL